jgi:hypothetical protein
LLPVTAAMNARAIIEDLVPKLTPNASVIAIEERERAYLVTIAGTTAVTAQCELPRETLEAAVHSAGARGVLEECLKRAADSTVAEVPDGRG